MVNEGKISTKSVSGPHMTKKKIFAMADIYFILFLYIFFPEPKSVQFRQSTQFCSELSWGHIHLCPNLGGEGAEGSKTKNSPLFQSIDRKSKVIEHI